jgi:hypothetical protein
MPIVDAERLNRFMNEPRWSAAQYEEADDVLTALENKLARRLGTFITPVPRVESVTILPSGLVNTTWHVHSVTSLDGTAIAEGAPLPDGWVIENHWLRRATNTTTTWTPPPFDLWSPGHVGLSGRADGVGRVTLSYMAGLGSLPELRLVILNKGKAVMDNRYSETVTARGLDTTEPPPLLSEEFTDAELSPLDNLRNLLAWR